MLLVAKPGEIFSNFSGAEKNNLSSLYKSIGCYISSTVEGMFYGPVEK